MTDKILVDRSTMEQALNSMTHMLALDLRSDYNLLTVSEYEMIRAEAVKLRENLEQAQAGEVVVTTNQQGQCVAVTRQDEEGHILSVIWEAKQPQVEQEPVAWIEHEWSGSGLRYLHFERPAPTVRDEVVCPVWTPLYTHPQPPRQPLTREEIAFIAAACGGLASDFVVSVARAIEAAHGVKGRK